MKPIYSLALVLVVAHFSDSHAMADGPTTAGGYRIGLNFLGSQHTSPYLGRLDQNSHVDDQFYPVQITNPASNAITDGALVGWTEAAAQRAVALAVENSFRAVNTGDPGRTLAIQITDGAVSASGAGRRLNVVLGHSDTIPAQFLGFTAGPGAFMPEIPNGSDISVVLLDHLDQLADVQFTQASNVINNIAGTTAHEIGQIFDLQEIAVSAQAPYPIMATGNMGLTNPMRFTVRQFETTLGTQAPGVSSASMLIDGIGTVAKTDFNMDGVTNLAGDGALLVANLGRTNALFQEGDANADHIVNLSGDGTKLIAALGTGLVASGVGLIDYDLATGPVLTSTNGAALMDEFLSPIRIVPEPSSFVLAVIASTAMIMFVRRYHKVA